MKVNKAILSLVFLLELSANVTFAGPIPPVPESTLTPKTNSKSGSNIKTSPKVVPDLPYKPGYPIDSASHPDEDTESTTAKGLDWNKVPFIPSKSPQFKPAPDPSYD